MELTVTLEYGPLNAEFCGEDQEEIQNSVTDFMDFLEKNSNDFKNVGISKVVNHTDVQASSPDGPKVRSPTAKSSHSRVTGKFESIAQRARADVEKLEQFLFYPDDENRVPFLRLDDFEDGVDVLGESKGDKQAKGSLILLFLMKEIEDKEEVDSQTLNKALQTSGIDPSNRGNMYKALDGEADRYFKRDNQGNVGLTDPGELAAVDVISELEEAYPE